MTAPVLIPVDFKFPKLTPWQTEVFNSPARQKYVVAGRRIGKTTFAKIMAITTALQYPGCKVAIVYPTMRQAKGLIFEEMLSMYDTYGRALFRSKDKQIMQFRLMNGSTIQFWGLETAKRIRGQKHALVIVDEYQDAKDNSGLEADVMSTMVNNIGDPYESKLLLFATSKGRNHLWEKLERIRREQKANPANKDLTRIWIIPTNLKNAPHIPESELLAMKASMPMNTWLREFECSFEAFEGLIYPMLSEVHHIKQMPPWETRRDCIFGLDFGYSPHPLGMTVIGIFNKHDCYVVDELKQTQLTVPDLFTKLKPMIDKYKPSKIISSPESGQQMTQLRDIFKTQGIMVDIIPAVNAVGEGINFVRTKLHHDFTNHWAPVPPTLFFACDPTMVPYAKQAWDEMRSYAYQDGKESPVKRNDDLCDSIRYALFTYDQIKRNQTVFASANVRAY